MSSQKPSSDRSKNKTLMQVDKKRLARKAPQNKSSALPVFLCFILTLAAAALIFLDDIKAALEVKAAPQKVVPKKKPNLTKTQEPEKKAPVKVVIPPKTPAEKSTELQALRQSFRPVDFDFEPLFDHMEVYLAQLDETAKAQEEKIIQEISDFRDQMIIDLYKYKFIGNIYIKDKKPLRATVIKVGNDTLLLQLKSGKQVSVKWSSLRLEQFEEFVTYFAFLEAENFQLGADMQQSFTKISDSFHQLAVFLQWYGREESSARVMKKARRFTL